MSASVLVCRRCVFEWSKESHDGPHRFFEPGGRGGSAVPNRQGMIRVVKALETVPEEASVHGASEAAGGAAAGFAAVGGGTAQPPARSTMRGQHAGQVRV